MCLGVGKFCGGHDTVVYSSETLFCSWRWCPFGQFGTTVHLAMIFVMEEIFGLESCVCCLVHHSIIGDVGITYICFGVGSNHATFGQVGMLICGCLVRLVASACYIWYLVHLVTLLHTWFVCPFCLLSSSQCGDYWDK